MANKRRIEIKDSDLQGLKYFKILKPLLERLHHNAADRDNPIVTSLRGIQQASTLAKVQKLFGCERAALGSLSEASRVFDPDLLQEIIQKLAENAQPLLVGKEAEALRGLTAVDGSLLPALPKVA